MKPKNVLKEKKVKNGLIVCLKHSKDIGLVHVRLPPKKIRETTYSQI